MALITMADVCRILAVSRDTAQYLVRHHADFPQVKATETGGRHEKRFWDAQEVRAWAKTRVMPHQAPAAVKPSLDGNLCEAFLQGRHDRANLQVKHLAKLRRARMNTPKTRIIHLDEADVQSSRDANPWAGLI